MAAQATYTHWFDVKDYTSVTVTVQTTDDDEATTYTSPLKLIWGQGTDDSPPYDAGLLGLTGDELKDEVARDSLPAMGATEIVTRQYDTKSRWVMFKTEKPSADVSDVILSYNFKKAPTELRIRDKDSADAGIGDNAIMRVTDNNARVLLTDISGNAIGVTTDTSLPAATVNSLYTHLADASGYSLDTVGSEAKTLAVSIRDASNAGIASTLNDGDMTVGGRTFIGNNAAAAVISNNIGVEQASTQAVVGAEFAGRALYYSLADKDGSQYKTTKNDVSNNSMYVHATDSEGNSITTDNRISVIFASRAQKIMYPFVTAIESSLEPVPALTDISFQLHSLGIANELPVTVWLKVYDLSSGKVDGVTTEFSNYTDDIVYNFPVPPGEYRDIHMSSGVNFSNGLYFRISQDYMYSGDYQTLGGDSGSTYVTGTYSF